MDHAAIRQAIRDLDRAFLADMEALPADAWQRPSDCDGWSIAAAFIHVVQVSELLRDSLARGRAGDPGPPPLAASEGVQAWRAARSERQRRAMSQPTSELISWYRSSVGQLNAELDAIAGASPDARGWHPIGAQPLGWIQDQWLFELALHDWDIRVALDAAAEVRDAAQAAFARTLPARLGRGFGGADDPSLAGIYRVELAAALPLVFSIEVADGTLVILANDAATPDATFRTDPSAFGLVLTNRRPVGQFVASSRWQASGDTARADRFAQAFKSY
jgi:uncharacterized protein (TIGR03083 family)